MMRLSTGFESEETNLLRDPGLKFVELDLASTGFPQQILIPLSNRVTGLEFQAIYLLQQLFRSRTEE